MGKQEWLPSIYAGTHSPRSTLSHRGTSFQSLSGRNRQDAMKEEAALQCNYAVDRGDPCRPVPTNRVLPAVPTLRCTSSLQKSLLLPLPSWLENILPSPIILQIKTRTHAWPGAPTLGSCLDDHLLGNLVRNCLIECTQKNATKGTDSLGSTLDEAACEV